MAHVDTTQGRQGTESEIGDLLEPASTYTYPFDLLRTHGRSDYIGEPISQLEHALQCAALAERAGASKTVVTAALFHDIGHLCQGPGIESTEDLGVVRHEDVGADLLLCAGFDLEVAELVRGHVQAKRYLVAINAHYNQKLSLASRRTLQLQGGAMSPDEVADFRRDPLRADKLRLRAWDEQAKDPNAVTPTLDDYLARLAF